MGNWQSLTVCNAYASQTPLTMVHVQGQFKKTSSPLLYKTCRPHDKVIADGDNFTFSLGDAGVGAFNITSASTRAIMVLIVGRDSTNTSKASFISHTFRGNEAQSAVLVDAYAGNSTGKAKVLDGKTPLDFFQEVALKPGAHMVSLNATGETGVASQVPVEVPNDKQAKYLVARVGYAPPAGGEQAFPQELVVLPLPLKPVAMPTQKPQRSSAASRDVMRPLLLLMLGGALMRTASALAD
uniref:DUF4397 domain-containing protein n=1 Tax=Alexandrium catenella TaxID=2925 RepID=A0A7S1R895_ALECA